MAATHRLYFDGAARVRGGPLSVAFTDGAGVPCISVWNAVEFSAVTAVSNDGNHALGVVTPDYGILYIWRSDVPFGDLHWVPGVEIQTAYCENTQPEASFQLWFDSHNVLHVAVLQATMAESNAFALHQYEVCRYGQALFPEAVFVAGAFEEPFSTCQGNFPRCVRICTGEIPDQKSALLTVLPALVEDAEHPDTYHCLDGTTYCVVRPGGQVVKLQSDVEPGDLCFVKPGGELFETGPRQRVSIDPARPLCPPARPDSYRVTADVDGRVYLGRADGSDEKLIIIGGGRPVLSQNRERVAEYCAGLVCYAVMPDALLNAAGKQKPVFGPPEEPETVGDEELCRRDLILTTRCAHGDIYEYMRRVPVYRQREVLPALLYLSECAARARVSLLECGADLLAVCKQIPEARGDSPWEEDVYGLEPWLCWMAELSGMAMRGRASVLKRWHG